MAEAVSSLPECNLAKDSVTPNIFVSHIADASSLNGIGALRSVWPNSQIILLISPKSFDLRLLSHCDGVINADANATEIASALAFLCQGGFPISRELMKQCSEANKSQETLTQREIEIVKLRRQGHSFKKIASLLQISPRTVYHYATNARHKLGVKDLRVHAQIFDSRKLDLATH